MRKLLAACALTVLAGLTGLAACSPAARQSAVTRMVGLPASEDAELQALVHSAPRALAQLPDHDLTAVLLLAGQRAGVERWRTADRIDIYIRQGMVIGTRGLGDDLMDLDEGGATAMILGRTRGRVTRFYRGLDGESRTLIRAYVCDIAPQGETMVAREGGAVAAFLVQESCQGPRDAFVNQYWLRGGTLLQSVQNLATSAGALHLYHLP